MEDKMNPGKCILCGGEFEMQDDGVAVCKDCGFELVLEAPSEMTKTVSTKPVSEEQPESKPKTRGRKKKEVNKESASTDEAPAFCTKCGSALNANGECEACNPKVEAVTQSEPVIEKPMMQKLVCDTCGGKIDMVDAHHGICINCKSRYFFDSNLSTEVENMLRDANKDLRMNDYDRAIIGFEDVLKNDKNNPEAHFGLFLAEFGIRYEDKGLSRRIPTLDRFNEQSVYDNENYQNAVKYATSEHLKKSYKEQADEIEGIRLEIAKLVKECDNFDVFICYKKSTLEAPDDPDKTTPEQKRARQVYNELFRQGYKVFFAEETLHNDPKYAGMKFEPVIFNALHTSKVMLLFTSRKEHTVATWVKNEWSRYLKLIRDGEKAAGSLITICVNGFNPGQLPPELNDSQALEDKDLNFFNSLMNRVQHFVNSYIAKSSLSRKEFKQKDLTSTKAIEREKLEKRKFAKTQEVVISATEEGELKNAYNFLEIGKFQLAESSFKKMLDKNERNDKARLGLEMARLCVKTEADYANHLWYCYNYVKEGDQYKLPEFEKLLGEARTKELQEMLIKYFYQAVLKSFELAKANKTNKKFADPHEKICAFVEVFIGFIRGVSAEVISKEEAKEYEKNVLKNLKDLLNGIVKKVKPAFEKIPYVKQAEKEYRALDLWFVLFDTYLRVLDIKDNEYANIIFKAMNQLCGEVKDVRLVKYINTLIEVMPNNIGIRLLDFVYKYGFTDYFHGKSLKQIKVMIDTVLPHDEENIEFVGELIKQVDELMFVQKKYELGFKVFDHIISYISKKYDDKLCDYLIKMGNIALFLGRYNNIAKGYFNNALSINPKDSRAHWGRLKTDIGIRDDFYLQLQRKDITEVESCQNAINCSENSPLYSYYMAIIKQQVDRLEKKKGKPTYVENPIVNSIFADFPRYKDYYCKEFLEHFAKRNGGYYRNLKKLVQTHLVFTHYTKNSKGGKKEVSAGEKYINAQPISPLVIHNERDAVLKNAVNQSAKSFKSAVTFAVIALAIIITLGVLASSNSAFFLPLIISTGIYAVISLLTPAVLYSHTKTGAICKWILIIVGGGIVLAGLIYLIITGILWKVIGFVVGGAIALFIGISILIGIIEGIKESI